MENSLIFTSLLSLPLLMVLFTPFISIPRDPVFQGPSLTHRQVYLSVTSLVGIPSLFS